MKQLAKLRTTGEYLYVQQTIDSAAMRRFQKKITFTYLNLEARKKLFKSYLLNPEDRLAAETITELEDLNNLTAGDFKNVHQ